MVLPTTNIAWPPPELARIRRRMSEWDAWYSSDPDVLRGVYAQGRQSTTRVTRPSQYAGGVAGVVARMFWGRPAPSSGPDTRLHVPIAADLAQASADLLYADPPTITSEDAETSAVLSSYLDDSAIEVLSGGAEIGAALGGRYHRVTTDPELVDRPFLSTVHADAAVPTFRWGRLVSVTFWTVVGTDRGRMFRHLERHELLPDGRGVTFHGLYEGTASELGSARPVTDHPSTEHLAKSLDEYGALDVPPTPGLSVAYIPNLTPNRAWRGLAAGKDLGRSDFDGIEGLFDALDETYTSWMRDVRVAKSRLLVPEYMTRGGQPGQGIAFDLDQEAYTTVRAAAGEDGDAPITPMQFSIRVEEHRATAQDLVEQILRSAGYSAATFGEDEDGAAATATETMARKGRSLLTRQRKIRLERPALTHLFTKMLHVDRAVFERSGIDPDAPLTVDFGESVQESALQLAQTTEALDRAQAASTETKVRMIHPDWSDTDVEEEVARIHREKGIGTFADPADPGTFG